MISVYRYILFMITCVIPILGNAQKVAADAKPGEMILKGKIGKINPPTQLWIYMGNEKWDTIAIQNGEFEYRKKTLLPAYGAIRVNYKPYYPDSIKSDPFTNMSLASVFFEKGKMNVFSDNDTISTSKIIIKGSKQHKRFKSFWKKHGDIIKEQKALAAEFNKASPEQLQSEVYLNEYERKNELILVRLDSLITSELKNYPQSFHSVMAYFNYQRARDPDENKARSIASLLSKKYQEFVEPTLKSKYKKIVQINNGDQAPEFTQNDLSGKPLKLSELKGKYVLLDFWASWCVPCRKVNPDLVKLYEKFKSSEFEILGISLDESQDKWKEAIQKDGLQWLHVSDLKGWENSVAQQYGISAVPQNFFLDKEGKVIAKNLKIEDIEKELERIFITKVNEDKFLIRGEIHPVGDLRYANKAILVYPGAQRRDTALIRNNSFQFMGKSSGDFQRATLYLQYNNLDSNSNRTIWSNDSRTLLVEKGKIEVIIPGPVNNAIVNGGKQNNIWNDYLRLTSPHHTRIDSLRAKRQTIDSVVYREQLTKEREALNLAQKTFILRYPSFRYSLDLLDTQVKDYLSRQWVNDDDDQGLFEYITLFNALSPDLKKEGAHILKQLESSRQRTIIPFTGETPEGKLFDIASLKGKVFLIDFWGSWCIWCRKGHPHLKELYSKYKDKGFEILGIGHELFAGDREKQWKVFREAIQKDGITWLQVLNDPEKNDLTKVYMVQSYPTKILVDRNGKILLRVGDDHDRKIDAKLKELFGF